MVSIPQIKAIVKQIKNAVQFSFPIQAPPQSSMAPAANINETIVVIDKISSYKRRQDFKRV